MATMAGVQDAAPNPYGDFDEFNVFVDEHRLTHDVNLAHDMAIAEEAEREAFGGIAATFRDGMAVMQAVTLIPWPTLVTRHSTDELLQLSEARAALAARDRAEYYRPRNLLLAAGGLLTVATCTVGGAYAWLTERSAQNIPQEATPKPLDPHAPADPHLVANMTVKPLGEGIRTMVALTGEVGMSIGAAAIVGATVVALAVKKGHRARRAAEIAAMAAEAKVADVSEDKQLPLPGHEADTTVSPWTLTDEIMNLRPKAKRRWRERLASTSNWQQDS